MKRRIVLFVLCLALLSLCACGKAEPQTTAAGTSTDTTASADTTDEAAAPETMTEAPTEMSTEPETFAAATIRVGFVADLPPQGQYDLFTAVDSPQTKIILSTNATVRDFTVLELSNGEIDNDGEMRFDILELHKLDRLTPDRPLVVATTFYGMIPNNGISYVDETGATRTFAVDMSSEDGSLYLWEIH